jgi:hypothetical protein
MLRGGRGGQVRLKLFLSYLWLQTDELGVPLAYPAQVWAQLLGLGRPDDAGARRIHEAQAWLERNHFISVEARPGHANRVTVLNESGTGEPYTAPGAAVSRKGEDRSRHLYVQIPTALWTSGYMAMLTGAGLAMYLVLLDQYGPGQLPTDPDPVWFSPKLFTERYALSDDTRAKGINDLRELGLITIRRQAINPDDFDLQRIRNAYTLQPAMFDAPAVRRRQESLPFYSPTARSDTVSSVPQDDTRIARATAHYPPAAITPSQFEEFAAELLGASEPVVDDLAVTLNEEVAGVDGTYEFDAVVRYQFADMSFLVLVEAKLHKNPIKRELVQVLQQKVRSVGGHKGVMISTAPYQRGAVEFAKTHGIALVTVTEGRFLFETRNMEPSQLMSREEAAERFNLPTFVAHYYGSGNEPGSTRVWLMSPEYPKYPNYVAEFLLGSSGER